VRSGNDLVYFALRRPETRDHVVARGQESGEARQKIRLSLIYRHQTLIVRDSFPLCPFTLLFSLTVFSNASILHSRLHDYMPTHYGISHIPRSPRRGPQPNIPPTPHPASSLHLTTPQQPSYICSNPIRVPKSTRRSKADPL
jgi:hypothetical protein